VATPEEQTMADHRTARASLAAFTSVAAVVLGLLAGGGGLALALAFVSSRQPLGQIATASAMAVAGIVNVVASRGIYQERSRPILVSGIATMGLLGYLAVAARDFGELFWLHALYLGLLAALSRRRHSRATTAA
jgi:hypothetical protein